MKTTVLKGKGREEGQVAIPFGDDAQGREEGLRSNVLSPSAPSSEFA